jgi:exodeoxyribonuclease VII large subunit
MNENTVASPPAMTVGAFVRLARQTVEAHLPLTWIGGELSNFTRAASGHWYFVLKDDAAQVRCVMFRGRNQFIDWTPVNGDRVEVRGLATLYEARGEFQVGVEALRRAGLGALFEALARLKARLAAEGLFDPARKRALPPYPARIGIVTSPTAAALRDVLHALARRWPRAHVVLYPTPVQGEGAGAKIAAMIDTASRRAECDVLLVVRGGGSIEDLWAFNDEAVVRAIAACALPVISGVGHETDFTLADFAADLRAATPTAAAELATPDAPALRIGLAGTARALTQAWLRQARARAQRLDHAARLLVPPRQRLAAQRARTEHLWKQIEHLMRARLLGDQNRLARHAHRLARHAPQPTDAARTLRERHARLASSTQRVLERHARRLELIAARLEALGPRAVLARGYAIVARADGTVIRDAAQCAPGDALGITLARGGIDVRVEAIPPDN